MNTEKEKLDHIITILSALRDGKLVQYKCDNYGSTHSTLDSINMIELKSNPERYQIKPEPREGWCLIAKNTKDICSALYETREGLEKAIMHFKDSPSYNAYEIIHVREVID